jgi:hypothetical protein
VFPQSKSPKNSQNYEMFQQMMESRQEPAQNEVAYGRYIGRGNNGLMSPQPNYNRNIENFSTLNAMNGLNQNFL